MYGRASAAFLLFNAILISSDPAFASAIASFDSSCAIFFTQIAVYCIRAPILEDITQLAKEQSITIFEKQQIFQECLALMIQDYLPMLDTCNEYKNQPKISDQFMLTKFKNLYELGKLGGGAALGYYFSGVRVELEGLMSSTVFWKKL